MDGSYRPRYNHCVRSSGLKPSRMFTVSIVALVTPFRDGEVDRAKLTERADFPVGRGPAGPPQRATPGESAVRTDLLSDAMYEVSRDELLGQGLYLDMNPYQAHIFDVAVRGVHFSFGADFPKS